MKDFANRVALRLPFVRRFFESHLPHGAEGVRQVGHRRYVGAMWDEIGQLQFQFMLDQGLKSHHYLADIACGSLRGGVHFIPYLDVGHYLGIEKEERLLRAGVEKELGRALFDQKKPELVVSNRFEFEKFTAKPDFALAQSLFTHLPPSLIRLCLERLRSNIAGAGVFFATFLESREAVSNPSAPHDHLRFFYTREEMETFGVETGWRPEYLGEWNHPRGQIMMRFTP